MIWALTLLLLSQVSFAESFETSYLQLELPTGWTCQLQKKSWLCRSIDSQESKESYISIKAKLSSTNENINTFLSKLQRPITLIGVRDKINLSKVYSSSLTNINSHQWVQAIHLSSEVPNYFTKYLVTRKGDLSIAVELTYHQTRYKKYAQIIESVAKSLRIKSSYPTDAKFVLLPQDTKTFPGITDTDMFSDDSLTKEHIGTKPYLYFIAFGLIIFVGLFLYWKVF